MEDDDRYIETMRLIVDQMKLQQEADENGMSEELVERQVEINSRRSEYDIEDKEEIIYTDENGKVFVQ